MKWFRPSLIAMAVVLATVALPAVAEAHHTTLTASCVDEGDGPVVRYQVQFVTFSAANSKTSISGTVKVDGATVRTLPPTDQISWNGDNGTLSGSVPGTPGVSSTVTSKFSWQQNTTSVDEPEKSATTGKCPKPALTIEKDGPATAYVGDEVTFTYTVTNTGNVSLANPVVTDDKCSPVVKVPDGQNSFDPGDVWSYTCTTTIPEDVGDSLINTAEACAEWSNPSGPDRDVCDEDTHTTVIPRPAIALEKTGAATAAAGSTYTYSFVATNTGNVTLTEVTLTDAKCDATLVRSDPPPLDETFDPGDAWSFSCTVVAPAGPAQVDNIAEVCATFDNGELEPVTVCDEDTHTFTVPPVTPPVITPPVITPPVITPPGGGQLPEEVISGRAQLRGPSGCVHQAFTARVTGREIVSVAFSVDGKVVKRINAAKGTYKVKIRPSRLGFGRHRVVARVRFTTESGTATRRLPLTFRRCARGAVQPRFTG